LEQRERTIGGGGGSGAGRLMVMYLTAARNQLRDWNDLEALI